jgi:hypothetical protein
MHLADSNEYLEMHVMSDDEKYASKAGIISHRRLFPDPRAEFAMQIIERFALVAARPDTLEDSAGRQQIRMQTPPEIVTFACEVADLSFAQFRQRGWLLHVPGYAELAGTKEAKGADA